MSTDRQDVSIAEQRDHLQRYAMRNGICITKEYEDRGISGDATEKRKAFQRMLRDAIEVGDFKTILCWDIDRFGRFDAIEAGYWIWPLRERGIRLVTIAQGEVNWDSFSGRMLYAIEQEGKHSFLRDLSRNVARGQLANAVSGNFKGGIAPYGYDRMLVDEHGDARQRLRVDEQVSRPRGWKSKLVPTDDPEILRIARWIFTEYVKPERSIRSIVDDLNREKTAPPHTPFKTTHWSAGILKTMLSNPCYCGDSVFGRRPVGKYHYCSDGEIVAVDRTDKKYKVAPVKIKNAVGAIIDRETWNRVQEKLRANNKELAYRGPRQVYLFTGLLQCGHCGHRMHGQMSHGTIKYYCSTFYERGPSACPRHFIRESRLLSFVQKQMIAYVLRPDLLPKVRGLIRDRIRGAQGGDAAKAAHLKHSLQRLDEQLGIATDRILAVPPGAMRAIAVKIDALQRHRDKTARLLEQYNHEWMTAIQIDEAVERSVETLRNFHEKITSPKREVVRQAIGSLVESITLRFATAPVPHRVKRPFETGTMRVHTQPHVVLGDALWTFSQKAIVHFTVIEMPNE
jgi:site-specific DNA recombinase